MTRPSTWTDSYSTQNRRPIQRAKIMVDGLPYETNGATYEDLVSLRDRVAEQDVEKLELAIRVAMAMGLRAPPMPQASVAADDDSGMRRRRAAPVTAVATTADEPVPAAPASFATVHGPAAHGPAAWASTGASVISGYPDAAALRNSSVDMSSMAARAVRDFRKGHYKDAAISSAQSVLSAGQVALSTPGAHVLNHAAGAAVGSPVPLPAADAVWYPANYAKEGLEQFRDPKDKTQ